MKTKLFIFLSYLFISYISNAQQTQIQYLSGTGSDHTVEWDFFCTNGNNSNKWTKISVPSCWEQQGFGEYNYGLDLYTQEKDSTYKVADEQGLYKHKFKAPKSWENKAVFIVFDGVMTDAEVKINNKLAGPIHQGAFYQFKYEISELLNYGEDNILEVTVSKLSSNNLVNMAERRADYWVFGGIFRPVYLEVKPIEHIERVAINAKADGTFNIDVYLGNCEKTNLISARIKTISGEYIGNNFSASLKKNDKIQLQTKLNDIKTWSPEFPNMYYVEVKLKQGEELIHILTERFGFRTVEVRRNDGIYVNDVKILFKGVNKHCFHPETGRTTNKSLSISDVLLMKEMNMNAVRMSHYPPDVHFLDVCDSLGLFVLDELAGWQVPAYDIEIGKKLVREMVIRDVNHPCIVLWDNANEGGWNAELDNEFAKYDPQQRHVIHPWADFDGTDTQHYLSYEGGVNSFLNGDDIFFPTEFLHGLYDGGLGAGLEDYWDLMTKQSNSAGGFLWCLLDEGIVRTDQDNKIDTDGNHAPDGILGPYREKEGSFYTIKELWSPIKVYQKNITPEFNGKLLIENKFFYTNLNECKFEWQLINFPEPISKNTTNIIQISKVLSLPSVAPQMREYLEMQLPENWSKNDALCLIVSDPHGQEVYKNIWCFETAENIAEKIITEDNTSKFTIYEDKETITISVQDLKVSFDVTSGYLVKVIKEGNVIPFNNGPIIMCKDNSSIIKHFEQGDKYIIDVDYKNNEFHYQWIINGNGWIELDYEYKPSSGYHDELGINFSYPEENINSVKFLADGPYRVWKNRMKGPQLGVWNKTYNNTITGYTWDYPEFKGYYSNFYWAVFDTKETPFTIVCGTENLFLRLFTPEFPDNAKNAQVKFPEGDISFMHAIPPIGTKFLEAKDLSPQGRKHYYNNWGNKLPPFTGKLYFYFGERK